LPTTLADTGPGSDDIRAPYHTRSELAPADIRSWEGNPEAPCVTRVEHDELSLYMPDREWASPISPELRRLVAFLKAEDGSIVTR
jgi:hypothetical protein